MYLFNPDHGATIHKINFEFKRYFDEKSFEPGEVISVEDEFGRFLIGIYEFLEVVDEHKAKELYAGQKKHVCDVCNRSFAVEIGLISHKRTHEKKTDLGIPIAEGSTAEKSHKSLNELQTAIEAEAKKDGLEGEGLMQENLTTL